MFLFWQDHVFGLVGARPASLNRLYGKRLERRQGAPRGVELTD